MTHQHHAPTVILFEEQTIYGPVYRPVNECAKSIARLMDEPRIPADRLAEIRRLGYWIELEQSEVIPFPGARR